MWILPAISETLKVSLQLPTFGPLSCCESCPGPGWREERLGCSWPGILAEESHGIALWGTGLKASHLLPFTSLVKQASAQAAASCPGFSFPPSFPVALRSLISLSGHIPSLLLPCLVRPTGFLCPGELSRAQISTPWALEGHP